MQPQALARGVRPPAGPRAAAAHDAAVVSSWGQQAVHEYASALQWEVPALARFDYFISYAHDDRAWAAWLAWQLESLGYRVVLDRWDLRPGDEFAGKLMELIQDSSNVIALLSKNYLSSSFTQSEWLPLIIRGPVEGPGVVPVRIDDVKTPLLLRENVGVSLVGLDSKSAAVRITESFGPKGVRPRASTPPPFPQRDSSGGLPEQRERRGRVFVSYSHKDSAWLDKVLVFLRPIERAGSIEIWSDRRMEAGDQWREEIERALSNTDAALLLVSSDFLASDFIHNEELPRILEQAENRSTAVYSLILRPCRYGRSPLSKFQSFNSPDQSLYKLKGYEREELLVRVVDIIEDSFK